MRIEIQQQNNLAESVWDAVPGDECESIADAEAVIAHLAGEFGCEPELFRGVDLDTGEVVA
jgi:hypothetical protein